MSTLDASIRQSMVQVRQALQHAQKMQKRAAATAEARGRIRVTLLTLARYEPRYADLLVSLEDDWRVVPYC